MQLWCFMQMMLRRAEIHTHILVCIYKKCRCAPFLACLQAEDFPLFSSCLGEQRAFSKGVRQKDKQFVVTIVLPANSRDLAVPSKQLAVGHKDTLCEPPSSSFITTELQTFTTSRYTLTKDSESTTAVDKNKDFFKPLGWTLLHPKLIFSVIHLS